MKKPVGNPTGFRVYPGVVLLFHAVASAVPSALEGLTSVFGMGTGVSPPQWSPNNGNYTEPGDETFTFPPCGEVGGEAAGWGETNLLSGPSSAGSKALDLPSLRGRHVVRTPSHLAHEPLLLHLAAELAQRLFELFGILDDYSHDRTRIQAMQNRPLVKSAARPLASPTGSLPQSSPFRCGYRSSRPT